MSDKPKSRDLLGSGSGKDFFGAVAYVSHTPTSADAAANASAKAPPPAVKRKAKPPPKSPRARATMQAGGGDGSTAGDSGGSGDGDDGNDDAEPEPEKKAPERKPQKPLAEAGKDSTPGSGPASRPATLARRPSSGPGGFDAFAASNGRVGLAMSGGDGVRLSQLRTVRQDGRLVVQRRACRLVKHSAERDDAVRLLRDDDTIVETFQMSQLQRVVVGAKTPTMMRAVEYEVSRDVRNSLGLPPEEDAAKDGVAKAAKWTELTARVAEAQCLTIIYGNQYLDFEVAHGDQSGSGEAAVGAAALGQWLVWVTVLASMNAEMAGPDDDAFGGMVTPLTPRSGRRGSAGVEEASIVGVANVYPAAEYGELPNSPVERVAETSEGMVSDSTGWASSHAGCLTCHGTELHRSSNPDMTIKGKHNQDAACTVWPLGGDANMALFGVFDGHGDSGHRCSHFCMRRICEEVVSRSAELHANAGGVLRDAFLKANDLLEARHPAWADAGGTTACVVVQVGAQLTIANCGDSRFVLGRRREAPGSPLEHKDLSVDQNPDDKEEKTRIEKCGGFVGREDPKSEVRVWVDSSMSSSGLSMARSLGDSGFKSVGVTAEPVISEHTIKSSKDEVLVGASDGVWSVLGSAKVMAMVDDLGSRHGAGSGGLHASRCAQALVTACAMKWKEDEGDYRDDITAIVVRLPLLAGVLGPSQRGAPRGSGRAAADGGCAPLEAAAGGLGAGDGDDEELKARLAKRIHRAKGQRAKEQGASMDGGGGGGGKAAPPPVPRKGSIKGGGDDDDDGSVATSASGSPRKLSLKERRASEKEERQPSAPSQPPVAVANCPKSCGLKQYNCPNDTMACVLCAAKVGKGNPFFGCKACKHTLCAGCYKGGGAAATPSGGGAKERPASSFFGASFEEAAPPAKASSSAAAPAVSPVGAAAAKKAEANCSGGHGLKQYNAPSDAIVCGKCGAGMKKGAPFHGCKACKERICVACFAS